MLPHILRYFYDKIFPKPNGGDYTKTEVIQNEEDKFEKVKGGSSGASVIRIYYPNASHQN